MESGLEQQSKVKLRSRCAMLPLLCHVTIVSPDSCDLTRVT
jgi:hypothetical protein